MADDEVPQLAKPSWWATPRTLPTWVLVVIVLVTLGIGGAAGQGSKRSGGGGSDNSDEIAALEQENEQLQAQLDAEPAETAAEREARLAAEQAEKDRQAAEAQATADFLAAQEKNAVAGDGLYEIGVDVNPGRFRTSGGEGCYYAILNSPDTGDIATNDFGPGPKIAELPTGKFFETSGCGGWTHE